MATPIRQFLVRTRFRYLLAALTLCMMLVPWLATQAGGEMGIRISVTVLLLGGVYAVAGRRRDLVIAMILGVPSIATDWLGFLTDSQWQVAINHLTSIAFVGFLVWRIMEEVYHDEEVTADTIMGSICAYLLIGWLFAFLYALAEKLSPGSLSGVAPTKAADSYDNFATFVYYSFVTLTTLGYGEVVPVGPFARSLAYFEAVLGQLFPAVLIARFVGIHISQSIQSKVSS